MSINYNAAAAAMNGPLNGSASATVAEFKRLSGKVCAHGKDKNAECTKCGRGGHAA